MTKVIIHSIFHPIPDPSLDYRDAVRDNTLTHVGGQGGETGRRHKCTGVSIHK